MAKQIAKKNGHGGKRSGAGRKRGAQTRRVASAKFEEKLHQYFAILPLQHMLSVLNSKNAPASRKDEMARAAAPYIHPKIVPVDITSTSARLGANQALDLDKLTEGEVAILEQLMSKATITMPTMIEAEAKEFDPTDPFAYLKGITKKPAVMPATDPSASKPQPEGDE